MYQEQNIAEQNPDIARIIEIGKQELMQDFDISPIVEEAHDFIHEGIYKFNS